MILYLDTETSGLYPGQICQLTYIMQDKFKAVAKNFFFTVDYVESGAEAVHGFSVEKLKVLSNGKRFSDCFAEIDKDICSADLVVAHNSAFDFMFLRAEYERLNEEFVVKEQMCSMKKTTCICKIPKSRGYGYKYPKLSEMCEYFNVSSVEIQNKTKEMFLSESAFHDARFDTTALYLAMSRAMQTEKDLSELRDYL